jgi:periplasmic divalent cation tolerance protein
MTTVGASFDAAALARELVEKRLAACVNIAGGLRSIYRWKDAIEDENEQLLIFKTVEANVEPLREALFARHPYEVPEFIVLRIDTLSVPYLEWLIGSVSGTSSPSTPGRTGTPPPR